MSTFSSFSLIKYSLLIFLTERTMNNFIEVGYFIISGVFQVYLTYFMVKRSKEMIQAMQKREEFGRRFPQGLTDRFKNTEFWLTLASITLSVLMSAVKQFLWNDSLEDILLDNSREAAEGLMIWTTYQIKNTTAISSEYGTDLNYTTGILALFGIISNFCWNLQMDCFKDIIFWVAKINEYHILAFGRRIKTSTSQRMITGNRNSLREDDQCWQMYREVMELHASVNKPFYIVLAIALMYSFLTLSYFLTYLLSDQISTVVILIVGYNSLKGIIFLIPGHRASSQVYNTLPTIYVIFFFPRMLQNLIFCFFQNDQCRKWIQTLPCETKRFRIGGTTYTREVMLWELEKEPLGLGTGKIHINSEFIFTV